MSCLWRRRKRRAVDPRHIRVVVAELRVNDVEKRAGRVAPKLEEHAATNGFAQRIVQAMGGES